MEAIIIAACAAFAGALIAMVVYHVAFVTPALRRLHAHAQLARGVERADQRLRELDALSETDVSRIRFVRGTASQS